MRNKTLRREEVGWKPRFHRQQPRPEEPKPCDPNEINAPSDCSVDLLINAGLLVLILGSSALLTSAYARRAYNRCPDCGSLNAKRRSECRACGRTIGG